MSAGDTPDILEACPIDKGFIFTTFEDIITKEIRD